MTATSPAPYQRLLRSPLRMLVLALFSAFSLNHHAAASHCPADLNGNGAVDAADLTTLLSSWGTPGGDVDGNGTTNAADLSALLAAWGACPEPEPTVFLGSLVRIDGSPVPNAVVVSNLGGSAASGKSGQFELALPVPAGTKSVTLTAMATIGGTLFQGSAVVSPVTVGGENLVDPIVLLADGAGCKGEFIAAGGFSNGEVYALAVYDDGTGPALYAGGSFTIASGFPANRIAKWNGSSWTEVGGGMDFPVFALTAFGTAGGTALYAGGSFTTAGGDPASGIAAWNGEFWGEPSGGVDGAIGAFAVFNDGTGDRLVAAGQFSAAGGTPANNIASFDGFFWRSLGSGLTGGTVRALAVFDDGKGSAAELFAGGSFSASGGVPTGSVAFWNGTVWSATGSGAPTGSVNALAFFDDGDGPAIFAGGSGFDAIARLDATGWRNLGGTNGEVQAFAAFDDGNGPALYAGGSFTTIGNTAANRLARWDGTAWSAVGEGVSVATDTSVRALAAFDDGSGSALFIAGGITAAQGAPANRIVKWSCSRPCKSGFDWLPGFAAPDVNERVQAFAVFDDGSGDALYVGGFFTSAGGPAQFVAKWDGVSFSPVGGIDTQIGGPVYAMTVFDDGTGPALYAGGSFSTAGGGPANGIAKWDGAAWRQLGLGVNGLVLALEVFDDGTGPALFVGGTFSTAGGVAANRIAKWNGLAWTQVGPSGLAGTVEALETFDDGSGPKLYAGGTFTSVFGGVVARNIARWNGVEWQAVGEGTNTTVLSLAVHDDGSGPALYAGGTFTSAGGVAASRIARWDGAAWSGVGAGLPSEVRALSSTNGVGGDRLHAAGRFVFSGGQLASSLARWSGGSGWSFVAADSPGDVGTAHALGLFDDGSGPALHVGGTFTRIGGLRVGNLARTRDGFNWSALGNGFSQSSFGSPVSAFAVFDDGSGPALYVGGSFESVGGIEARGIARWNGRRWTSLDASLLADVRCLAVYDDGNGPALYAGGTLNFTAANGALAKNIAKWNGSGWSALGEGTNDAVNALAVFDDGTGAALYATGNFSQIGGAGVNRIARWNGSSWSPLGSGLAGSGAQGFSLAVYDDGTGAALYSGGTFTTAGGTPASNIAKWNGSAWSALGAGVDSRVRALAVFDDGSGSALYAGGAFSTAGGVSARRVARWRDAQWSALGSGITSAGAIVLVMTVFDDGDGPALFVGGNFFGAGDMPAKHLARWHGEAWSEPGFGLSSEVRALASFNDGRGKALFVGGRFAVAGSTSSSRIAKWGCAN